MHRGVPLRMRYMVKNHDKCINMLGNKDKRMTTQKELGKLLEDILELLHKT